MNEIDSIKRRITRLEEKRRHAVLFVLSILCAAPLLLSILFNTIEMQEAISQLFYYAGGIAITVIGTLVPIYAVCLYVSE
jgi:hypothetical protein